MNFSVHVPNINSFNNLTLCLIFQTFFSNLESGGGEIDKGLVKRGLQFRDHLTKKFKWDFSVEPSECAPTIVDI